MLALMYRYTAVQSGSDHTVGLPAVAIGRGAVSRFREYWLYAQMMLSFNLFLSVFAA